MKKVSFAGKRPSALPPANLDDWVKNRETIPREPTKRLTIDVPIGLHTRMKAQCVMQNLVMADVMREFLERRFPNTSEPGGPS